MRKQHVPRHGGDLEHVRELFAIERDLVQKLGERLTEERNLFDLSGLSTTATGEVACAAILDPARPNLAPLIRLAARSQATIWALAHSEGRAVEIPVTTDVPQRWEGKIDQSDLSSVSWLDAYFLAVLAGDALSLAAVCHAPIELWRASSSRTEEYVHLFAEAMRLYALRDDAAGPKLLAALRATDKSQRHLLSEDWGLDIDVPMIEVAARLFSLDATGLNASLAKAFELYRRYWGAPARVRNTNAVFARALAALMLLARRRGLVVTTTSDYAPSAMLDAFERAADRSLTLCPYCMVPIPSGASICHACLEDPRNDAAFEMTTEDYTSRRRKRCTSCNVSIPDLVVRCPSCRSRQYENPRVATSGLHVARHEIDMAIGQPFARWTSRRSRS